MRREGKGTQVADTVTMMPTWVPFIRTRYPLVLAGNDSVVTP
jgi:hypothetical protein